MKIHKIRTDHFDWEIWYDRHCRLWFVARLDEDGSLAQADFFPRLEAAVDWTHCEDTLLVERMAKISGSA